MYITSKKIGCTPDIPIYLLSVIICMRANIRSQQKVYYYFIIVMYCRYIEPIIFSVLFFLGIIIISVVCLIFFAWLQFYYSYTQCVVCVRAINAHI